MTRVAVTVGIVWLAAAPAQLASAAPAPVAGASPSAAPRITGVQPRVLLGEPFCVCGWFPTAAARSGIRLGPTPLGEPLAGGGGVLTFLAPAEGAVGVTQVSGASAAGFAPGDARPTEVLAVVGAVDRERLLQGEATPLELRVEGTRDSVTLHLRNLTPGVVTLEGGESQVVTTSGGAVNRVLRTVHAVTPGDFQIQYELPPTTCPCAGSAPTALPTESAGSAAPPGFVSCVEAFARGRELADRARQLALAGDPQAASVAGQAAEELTRAGELLDAGLRSGEIGPLSGASLRQYIDGYLERTGQLAPPSRGSELLQGPRVGLDLEVISVTGTTYAVDLDYGMKISVDWKDDPRDAPPPAVYGEEPEDVRPTGIVLVRGQDDWIPTDGGTTYVRAKLYEPDPARPGVWLPSSDRRRRIRVRFVERSHELGTCLNGDLPQHPQDSPDLFFRKAMIENVRCVDDPTGRGHFGDCSSYFPENERFFWVKSEDYGAFSTLEASCDGCVQLTPVPQRGVVYPPAVQDPEPRRWRLKLPSDWNDNQIADDYPPEKIELQRADEDSERAPEGDGTRGDGYSAYEEYRGFLTSSEYAHLRTDAKRKTLLLENDEHFPTALFEERSGLELVRVNSQFHRRRVANYNGGHAKLHDQHLLRLWPGPLDKGVAGMSFGFGPPRNVEKVVINITADGSASLVAHELGHAVGMRHHGNTPWDITKDPHGDEFKEEIRAMSGGLGDLWPGRVHSGPTLCGKQLPARFSVGEKGDQASGFAHCIMRYNFWRDVYLQTGGDYDCMPQGLERQRFCESPGGTGPNGGGRTAGDATVGDCLGQMVVNDGP